jgi:ribosomal protein L11 methyltransferase
MKDTVPQYKTRVELLLEKGVEELLPEELYTLSASGVWTEEKDGTVLVRFYPEDGEAFLEAVKNSHLPVLEIRKELEELKDYSALTKKYFRPIRIEDLTILPPWSKRKPGGPSLVIEPGMAFGTGRHESTKLMIKIMRSIDFKGAAVLDLGCGSGILSLYAALLGAKTVVAVDNDLDTVLNARKNVTLNKAGNIEVVCADLADIGGSYDVILANLDIRTFTTYAPTVIAFAKSGTKVVVSGILGRDRTKLLPLFQSLEFTRMEQKNSWRGFLFEVNSEK